MPFQDALSGSQGLSSSPLAIAPGFWSRWGSLPGGSHNSRLDLQAPEAPLRLMSREQQSRQEASSFLGSSSCSCQDSALQELEASERVSQAMGPVSLPVLCCLEAEAGGGGEAGPVMPVLPGSTDGLTRTTLASAPHTCLHLTGLLLEASPAGRAVGRSRMCSSCNPVSFPAPHNQQSADFAGSLNILPQQATSLLHQWGSGDTART